MLLYRSSKPSGLKVMVNACVFCKISKGEIQAELIYSDELVFVVRDINPKSPVHLLVLPREHLTEISSSKSEQYDLFARMFYAANAAAQKVKINNSGYRLVVNQGPDSGQEIAHIHMHVLGGTRLGNMV